MASLVEGSFVSESGIPRAPLPAMMIRAGRLDPGLYRELQVEGTSPAQALAVVVLGTVSLWLGGIGLALTQGHDLRDQALAFLWIIPSMAAGWLMWTALAYVLGGGLPRGWARLGGLLRSLGFASSPGIFYVVILVPGVGGLVNLGILFWIWMAAVVALRATLGTPTARAVWISVAGIVLSLIIRDVLRP